jgi:predicted nucleic acid-binding protein
MAVKYIADKSALARMKYPPVAAVLSPLLVGGVVVTCGVIELEVLFSARTHADVVATRANRRALPSVDLSQADFDRAIKVLEGLAKLGHHRAAGIPDLLIAAVAERNALTVLHYDKDFDLIAKVTGQSAQWVVPAGSVP